jgi:nucleoside-diphosphate-sugar epimerase
MAPTASEIRTRPNAKTALTKRTFAKQTLDIKINLWYFQNKLSTFGRSLNPRNILGVRLKILITGSGGLVGRALAKTLRREGYEVVDLDLKNGPGQDIRNPRAVAAALDQVSGVVHLAAISRVVWAQRDPALCKEVNGTAFEQLLAQCAAARRPPWLIFSSSREVYGQQDTLPVSEAAPLRPMNVYARSKYHGEILVSGARGMLPAANVVRLSNVYGRIDDHADRVVPAFARAAAFGGSLRIEGGQNCFDFSHIDDVVHGLVELIRLTALGENLDPIHLTTGAGTTLDELANIAVSLARKPVNIVQKAPRDYDVSTFVGDTVRAGHVLGWGAHTMIKDGFAALISDFVGHTAANLVDGASVGRIPLHAP